MELLVVILIIVIVSVVALPTVMSAMGHRQVREAARLVQSALIGARDRAIHTNQPAGIRLLPDPNFDGTNLGTGLLDPTRTLACNRIIPLEMAPEYTEGLVSIYPAATYANTVRNPAGLNLPTPTLVLEESIYSVVAGAHVPNAPTSWSWNVRVGDKVQVNNAGTWYTVVGPIWTPNPEMFVNVGAIGSPLPKLGQGVPAEYLLLVDGRDDNNNGRIDEGWDGVDNDGNGLVDETSSATSPQLGEWREVEAWQGAVAVGATNLAYTIRRRPAPSIGAREIALPSGVVIDLTTWGTTRERSRIPAAMLGPHTGCVDIVLNPDGTVLPTTIYSSPASFGMGSAFVHLWLADRGDLATPLGTVAPLLPVPIGAALAAGTAPPNQVLKGDYALATVFSRTGNVLTTEAMPFDLGNTWTVAYNPGLPFVQVQQGSSGP